MDLELQFTDYINSYKGLILKVTSIYCYNEEERKDLFQEIVLQLWKSYRNYDSSYKLSTWTYKIALNVSISYVRKTTARNRVLKNYSQEIKHDIVEEIHENTKLNKLHEALKILKPIERAIITLNLEGNSNKEISEIIGISISNVSTRILRIKNKLKNKISK